MREGERWRKGRGWDGGGAERGRQGKEGGRGRGGGGGGGQRLGKGEGKKSRVDKGRRKGRRGDLTGEGEEWKVPWAMAAAWQHCSVSHLVLDAGVCGGVKDAETRVGEEPLCALGTEVALHSVEETDPGLGQQLVGVRRAQTRVQGACDKGAAPKAAAVKSRVRMMQPGIVRSTSQGGEKGGIRSHADTQ